MKKLRQVLAQEDTVLFIGSGISLWSGLPSWRQLVEELAEFLEASGGNASLVRSEAQKGDLLQAASYGFSKLTKSQIGDFIRTACRYGAAKPHEIHRKLVSLGPRCFLTTNYDNLIEESLRIWRSDLFFRPPVTNRHLTETAEIVHARATDFVFKPHGDAADSESIILTREQYRQLLPDGERHAALESVKMLLASRPVVYFGFGLRDPDFIYIRDVLANTYKGGVRDHFAVMADIVDAEVEYWRSTYGIHLIGYDTTPRVDNSRDHTKLLELLDELLLAPPSAGCPSATPTSHHLSSPDAILALARHAARLTQAPKCEPEFPVRVFLDKISGARTQFNSNWDEFNWCPVARFLDEGPSRAILVGPPGSGKSYSLQRAAATLAERLHATCLSETFDEKKVVVPILADLKLYNGDLYDLLNRALPNGLPLDELKRHYKLKIFIDSFNEMPREFWESGSYELDFAKIAAESVEVSFIIGSRTSDGLSKLGFPVYRLDHIDEEFVENELSRLKLEVDGRFERELRLLLQKPFYFQLVKNGTVNLAEVAHPRDFYNIFFRGLASSFQDRFGKPFDLEHALSLSAYEAINRGEEAQPLSALLETLKIQLGESGFHEMLAADVANWLVSKSVLIPYRGGRIAFFHQSATEYLAARELGVRYQKDSQILKEKLDFTRWDQALFLTLSLLPGRDSAAFLQTVVEKDFALALSATKYLEVDRDQIVSKLLAEIPDRIKRTSPQDHAICNALQFGLTVSETHEPQLRAIMKFGDLVGAAAVARLVELRGESVKGELLKALVEFRSDYNYCCNGIAPAIQPFAKPHDVQQIIVLSESIKNGVSRNSDEDAAHGFISGAAKFLSGINLDIIRNEFLPKNKSEALTEVRARILCNMLQDNHSTEALELAAELLTRGVTEAATAIHFISTFAKPNNNLSWSIFSDQHIDLLISDISVENSSSWSLSALASLSERRPDLAKIVQERALAASGLERAALLYSSNPKDPQPFFEAMTEFADVGLKKRGLHGSHLLGQVKVNWAGHENLYLRLLLMRDRVLATNLLSGDYPNWTLRELDIGPIDWWLQWLAEERGKKDGFWFCYQLVDLFSKVLNKEARHAFIDEFNKANCQHRPLLAEFILPRFGELRTDDFSEDAIEFLLSDLRDPKGSTTFHGHLLGTTATEQFVAERLLPLYKETRSRLPKRLRQILRDAGTRHGRRYMRS